MLKIHRLIYVVIFCSFLLILISCSKQKKNLYLAAAVGAANWMESSAVQSEYGKIWPAVPDESTIQDNWLYSGNSGIVLFFLEMFHTTGDAQYLDAAHAGADHLMSILSEENSAGFYSGISGIGFALFETYKVSKDVKYLEGFETCIQFLRDSAKEIGQGIEWSPTTDLISGTAGAGLFLIYAFKETKDLSILNLAELAGKRLIELGETVDNGMKWAMNPDYPRYMPNFSHGTAGIAYFLASLYMETEKEEFLLAAFSGANYLKAAALTEDDVCLIFHNEPDGEDLFYLGWCHGPVGTARLFYRLFQITQEQEWMEWVEKGAAAILESGIPEEAVEGFWNNVGVCCGSAGVADFFLSLYQITQKKDYLDFARRLTHDLLSRKTKTDSGMKWIQAEHRVRPDFLQAQTGLMQGSAGIGLWLLRLDAFDKDRIPQILFPDNPFSFIR
ncbi:lanthionine synthetase LanC family protein [Acidobacteriota bacterium]